MIAANTLAIPSPGKGVRPLKSSYSVTPIDQTSARASTSLLLISCSGDM